MPLSFRNGPQPFPIFHGRHILVAVIPFALCLAWVVHGAGTSVLRKCWVQHGWPIALAAIVAVAYANPRELNGFRDRPTSRVGKAVEQIIASTDWVDGREIFMPASLYLRYRVFFPPELRDRLRIAVDEASPPWWRDAAIDIESREKPLPPLGEAYLVATSVQLRGEMEYWDYGVGLPRDELAAWGDVPAIVRIGRLADRKIGPLGRDREDAERLLILVAGDRESTPQLARSGS